MAPWPHPERPLLNPRPSIRTVPLMHGQACLVIDDVLAEPQCAVDWACQQTFGAPVGYPYPGLVCEAPAQATRRMVDFFLQHLRHPFATRRILDATCRLSLVTVPPDALQPCQWQCHRDRVAPGRPDILFAASVLYLFHEPALGGTSFYVPRVPSAEIERLVADSVTLDARQFGARHGLRPGYMVDSNQHFERVATVPAAWNRLIVYDGGLFHSGDIGAPGALSANPARGRLTLNGFFTCRRLAA